MSEDQQIAIHEKFLKGINLRIVLAAAGFLITTVYYGTKALDTLESIKLELRDVKTDLRDTKIKVDTLARRQDLNNYNNNLHFQNIDNKLDSQHKK